MHITPEILRAAKDKAVKLGILPRRSQMEDLAANMELIQEILEAALAQSELPQGGSSNSDS